MSDSAELEAATIEAKAARERLTATTRELQARLDPALLLDEAKTGVERGARELAENVGDAARRRPGAAAGVAALATFLILRRPLGRLRRRLFRRSKETTDPQYR